MRAVSRLALLVDAGRVCAGPGPSVKLRHYPFVGVVDEPIIPGHSFPGRPLPRRARPAAVATCDRCEFCLELGGPARCCRYRPHVERQ